MQVLAFGPWMVCVLARQDAAILLCQMLLDAGLGSLQLEYDANKNPAIFQQLCELQLDLVIEKASSN